MRRIQQLPKLRAHIFGHIHKAGIEVSPEGLTYVNASICDGTYRATFPARVIEL